MRNRALLAAGASAVLALVLAGATFASGSSGGRSTAGPWGRGWVAPPASHPAQPKGSEVIQFTSQQTHAKLVDADDSGGPSVGDYFVFTENLFDAQHHLIGVDYPKCLFGYGATVCDGTFSLNGRGDIAVLGALTNSSNSLAVTGGTGDFLTAGGEAFVEPLPSGRTQFTIFLTS